MDRVQRRETAWDDAVRPIGKQLCCQRLLEARVRGCEDQDPRRHVPFLLVAVKEREGVVRVFRTDRCCSHPQVVGDDEVVRVIALASKELNSLPRDERPQCPLLVCRHIVVDLEQDFLDYLVRRIRQVLLQHVKSFVEPLPRTEFFSVVKLTDGVVVKSEEILWRVEQNARTALIIAAPELLSVVFDLCSVEVETKSIDGDRVVLDLRRI